FAHKWPAIASAAQFIFARGHTEQALESSSGNSNLNCTHLASAASLETLEPCLRSCPHQSSNSCVIESFQHAAKSSPSLDILLSVTWSCSGTIEARTRHPPPAIKSSSLRNQRTLQCR